MKLKRSIEHKLRKDQQRMIREAVKFVLSGDTDKARNTIKEAAVYNEILKAFSHPKRLLWSLSLAFCCLLIATFALVIRVDSTEVTLDLLVDGVTLSTAETELSAELRADGCYIDKVTSISSLPPDIMHTDSIPFDASLRGTGLSLKNIHLSKPATIELEEKLNTLRLFFTADTISGHFSLKQGELVFGNTSLAVAKKLAPSLFQFETTFKHPDIEPVRIDLERNTSCNLQWLNVNSLLFAAEDPPGSGQFVSTIRSGKIHLVEINREAEISERDFVRLDIRVSRRLIVKGDTDFLHLRFEGLISKLSNGSQKIEMNQMPTYIEYLYHNQQLYLFWSCVVFIWTILWGIKNALFTS